MAPPSPEDSPKESPAEDAQESANPGGPAGWTDVSLVSNWTLDQDPGPVPSKHEEEAFDIYVVYVYVTSQHTRSVEAYIKLPSPSNGPPELHKVDDLGGLRSQDWKAKGELFVGTLHCIWKRYKSDFQLLPAVRDAVDAEINTWNSNTFKKLVSLAQPVPSKVPAYDAARKRVDEENATNATQAEVFMAWFQGALLDHSLPSRKTWDKFGAAAVADIFQWDRTIAPICGGDSGIPKDTRLARLSGIQYAHFNAKKRRGHRAAASSTAVASKSGEIESLLARLAAKEPENADPFAKKYAVKMTPTSEKRKADHAAQPQGDQRLDAAATDRNDTRWRQHIVDRIHSLQEAVDRESNEALHVDLRLSRDIAALQGGSGQLRDDVSGVLKHIETLCNRLEEMSSRQAAEISMLEAKVRRLAEQVSQRGLEIDEEDAQREQSIDLMRQHLDFLHRSSKRRRFEGLE